MRRSQEDYGAIGMQVNSPPCFAFCVGVKDRAVIRAALGMQVAYQQSLRWTAHATLMWPKRDTTKPRDIISRWHFAF